MKIPRASSSKPNKGKKNKPFYTDKTDKEGLKDCIWRNHGIITLCCIELDISYCQFWQAVRRWELVDELEKAKKLLADKAQAVIFDALDSKSETTRLRAAETVMRHSNPPSQEITVKTSDTETIVKQVFGLD